MNENDALTKLSKEDFDKFLVEMNKVIFRELRDSGVHTVDTSFRQTVTKEDFMEMCDSVLYDFVLYGSKKTIDKIRDKVPKNCKICELPEEILINGFEDKVFLMKNESLLKQYDAWRDQNDYPKY